MIRWRRSSSRRMVSRVGVGMVGGDGRVGKGMMIE